MIWKTLPTLAAGLLLVVGVARGQDADAKIHQAMMAAPEAIGADATVMDWDGSVLREGTNGWTCYPTPAGIEGDAPMCLDGVWADWATAFMGQTTPAVHGFGIAYMLAGDTGASNSDPYATDPSKVDDWVNSGPHVMILVPDQAMLEDFSTDYTTGGPYVMWKGTPYAHIMVPISQPGD